ncbi:MAG TPA: electron transfer flavoprotein subunit alpha [Desulfobulbaceae bacterium]|nr:electron transfer flavoprotein subunit alpha [Desulfobulbaceae bacterium]
MILVDQETCVGCGACVDACPFAAIEMADELPVIGHACTLCGACVDACPSAALKLDGPVREQRGGQEAWRGVMIFAEFRHGRLAPVSLELLGAGRHLANTLGVPLSAALLGADAPEFQAAKQSLIHHGADTVYAAADPDLAHFSEENYTRILTAIIRRYQPEIVLAGATAIGRSFIPAVATHLGAGLTADCTDLDIRQEDRALLQTRPAFGGNIMATIVCPDMRPQMATVRPKVMRELPLDESRQGEIVAFTVEKDLLSARGRVVESVVAEADQVNIQEAEILVAGGRGLDDPKGFQLLRQLAEVMSGKVAASRAAVDAGWIPYPHQVGQTGKTVAPKLYIACGISGAIQHVAGMQSSETIVAINRDPHAPIFEVADYGLVGDLYEIVPKLIAQISERRGK